MPVTTIHDYIDNYPVNHTDRRMIVGTIHPHLTANFVIPYYYGNRSSLWDILGQAFPQHNFLTLPSIIQVLSDYNTWVTDIIRQCDRDDENVTRDALLYNVVYNTEQISDALNESEIDNLFYFTLWKEQCCKTLYTSFSHSL